MDNLTLTPRHDRGLWATTIIGALTALVALTLGAGFDLAGAVHWPVLDDITHAAGWLALAAYGTVIVRSATRAGIETGAHVETNIQSVREEMRAGRAELRRQAEAIAHMQERVAGIPDEVEKRVQAIVDGLEERLAEDFLTRSQETMDDVSGRGAQVRSLPTARRQPS